MAALQCAAAAAHEPLWRYLAQTDDLTMPLPEIQIIGGGAHAQGRIDLQDIMALPVGAPDWRTALDWCARTYHAMGAILAEAGQLRGVADEGGFWPDISGNEEALALMVRAIERAGLAPLDDVAISLDIAANQFYRGERYWLRADAHDFSPGEWVEQLATWCARYPVVLVEDPCAEDDRRHYGAFRRDGRAAEFDRRRRSRRHARRAHPRRRERGPDRRGADQTESGGHHDRRARGARRLYRFERDADRFGAFRRNRGRVDRAPCGGLAGADAQSGFDHAWRAHREME